jgi:phytoene dehydrogenase-like protein
MPSRALVGATPSPIRLATQSCQSFVERHFEHPKVRALWAVWGMHLDFPPHIHGGAVYPFLQCMQLQAAGISVGGARNMIDALAEFFRDVGGELRCGIRVQRIEIERSAARGWWRAVSASRPAAPSSRT